MCVTMQALFLKLQPQIIKNIKSYFWLFARLFQRADDVVLVDTYLTKWHEVLLQLLLKQFPQSYPKFDLNEKPKFPKGCERAFHQA